MKPLAPSSSRVSCLLKKARVSPILVTFLAFVAFVTILYSQDLLCLFGQFDYYDHPKRNKYQTISPTKKNGGKLPFAIGETEVGCDVFSGRWVRDEVNRPLYEESECPYIQPQLTCQEHGRPDKDYQYWRWQPHGCTLPRLANTLTRGTSLPEFQENRNNVKKLRDFENYKTAFNCFNATLMLETLRGKRMMFVGDSLNRGQYVSLVCLLHGLIPEDAKSMTTNGSLTIFTAKEYNATIEFYWAPFLLESNSDDAIVHRISDRLVRKGSIIKHGKNWKGVDIMVFNTYLWWMTGRTFKILQGSFTDQVKDIAEVSTEDAYRMGMKTMLRWIKRNMDPKKTRVFFTSMSPSHAKSIEWGGSPDGNCYNETKMIEDPNYWGSDTRKSIMQVIGEEFRKTRVPITFLNITQLSSYRRDAHTSIYKKQWSPLTPKQLANPVSYADCTHWCMPGLHDTWNELLFAKLFYP